MIQITWWGFTIVVLLFFLIGVNFGYMGARLQTRHYSDQDLKNIFMAGLADAAEDMHRNARH